MKALNDTLKLAYLKGYRAVDGKIISPYGRILKLGLDKTGYLKFYIYIGNNLRDEVYVHRLVAYQKYGNKMFNSDLVVRHLDGNRTNNKDNNILLGTQTDNLMDRPEASRMKHSIHAATKLRKFTDKEMDEIRIFHSGSYKDTMEMFSISSKGTLHRILNKEYKTKV